MVPARAPPRHGAPAFDLAEAWRRASERIEGFRGSVAARVLVESRASEALLSRFGAQATAIGSAVDGRVEVEARAQSVEALAEQLAGWAWVSEVVTPEAVRDELARIGARLRRMYGPGRE